MNYVELKAKAQEHFAKLNPSIEQVYQAHNDHPWFPNNPEDTKAFFRAKDMREAFIDGYLACARDMKK